MKRAEEVELLDHIKRSKHKSLLGNPDEVTDIGVIGDASSLKDQEANALKIATKMKPM